MAMRRWLQSGYGHGERGQKAQNERFNGEINWRLTDENKGGDSMRLRAKNSPQTRRSPLNLHPDQISVLL